MILRLSTSDPLAVGYLLADVEAVSVEAMETETSPEENVVLGAAVADGTKASVDNAHTSDSTARRQHGEEIMVPAEQDRCKF